MNLKRFSNYQAHLTRAFPDAIGFRGRVRIMKRNSWVGAEARKFRKGPLREFLPLSPFLSISVGNIAEWAIAVAALRRLSAHFRGVEKGHKGQ